MQIYIFKDSLFSDEIIEIRKVNEDIACFFYDPNMGKQYLWGTKGLEDGTFKKAYPF